MGLLGRLFSKKPNIEAYVSLGQEEFKKGNNKEAVEQFSNAIDLSPSSPDLYYYRAICLHNLKEWDKAIVDLKSSINRGLNPPTMAEHFLAKCLFHAGKYDESISLLNTLLVKNPNGFGNITHYQWLELRGMAFCKKGNFQEAEQYLEQARAPLSGSDVYQTSPIAFWLLVCKYRGDEDRAKKEWLDAL